MKVDCSAPLGAPTIADCIRNPGYRPTYSYSLACAISINPPCKHGEFMSAAQDFHSKKPLRSRGSQEAFLQHILLFVKGMNLFVICIADEHQADRAGKHLCNGECPPADSKSTNLCKDKCSRQKYNQLTKYRYCQA